MIRSVSADDSDWKTALVKLSFRLYCQMSYIVHAVFRSTVHCNPSLSLSLSLKGFLGKRPAITTTFNKKANSTVDSLVIELCCLFVELHEFPTVD